ncbi:hypothetical protein SGFS_045510 [Streptomyces graminofaciens]|uniref:Secreted protein n=1 Tax=Streptomyces graminofaciens TaxID=68212 RepID=A0ABM7FB74_9ACTN|nr:hypothetical protein SGFS_045510 [Streptomyces graminofaciens]
MPSRQKPKNAPRIFFQVNIRRMKLFFVAPPLAVPPFAATLAAARPPPVEPPDASVGVAVAVAVPPPDERLGAARRPPRWRARLSSARPMARSAPPL